MYSRLCVFPFFNQHLSFQHNFFSNILERHNISQIEAIQPTNGDVNASPIMCGDTILIVSRISRVLHKQTFLLCPHVSLVQSKKLRSEGYGMSLNR